MTQLYHHNSLQSIKITKWYLLFGVFISLFGFLPQYVYSQCSNISPTLSCSQVVVNMPYNLTFTGTEGGILDVNGKGSGFTMIQAPSNARLAEDGVATFAGVPGYEPSKININGGNLLLTANKGIAYINNNTQINTLGVGLKTNNKEINIESNLINPVTGANAAQAGIWYGLNDKNFVKIVVSDNKIEFRIERNDVSGVNDVLQSATINNITTSTVKLKLIVSNTTVKGYYKVGAGAEIYLGQYSHTFATGITIGTENNVSFAGIFDTYRNQTVTPPAQAFNIAFADFSITENQVQLSFSPSIQTSIQLQNEAKSFTQVINTSNGAFPTVNLLAKDAGNNVPTWLKLGNNVLDGTVNTDISAELTFTVDATGLAIGAYEATVTASANGFLSGNLQVQMIVQDPASTNPYVVAVNPPNGAIGLNPLGFGVSANQLYFPPNYGLDKTSVNNTTVQLWRLNAQDQEVENIPSNVNDTGGGDAINLTPSVNLLPNTKYRFKITTGVTATNPGPPTNTRNFVAFSSTFTTGDAVSGAGDLSSVIFSKVEGATLGAGTDGRYASLVIGPDGKLYAASIDGIIKRWTINADGTLANVQTLTPALTDQNGQVNPRLIIGLTFDPSSTAQNLIAYITHSASFNLGTGPTFDGKITKLSGPNLATVQDLVIHLPRSTKDHLTNSLAFGPDGALYVVQGSNSAGGAFDGAWQRDESLLAGAVLRLDLIKLNALPLPLDAITTNNIAVINAAPNNSITMSDGTYNPYAIGSPLTIYASGIRNAYDLVWHSNGQLYTPANGTAGGSNTPASINMTRRPNGTFYDQSNPAYPPIPAAINNEVQRDWVFRIVPGKYYGHPNPLRGEYVLNRGKIDVAKYPAGIVADVNYGGAAFDFGYNQSPNGAIEYKSNTFGGKLKGKLLVARFSLGDDIIVLEPGGANLNIANSYTGLTGMTGFVDPLDIVENTNNGHLYVAQYNRDVYPSLGAAKIILLKPNSPPVISVTPPTIYMNDPQNGGASPNQVITIQNTGTEDLKVTAITLGGINANQFAINGLPAFPLTLASNATRAFNVTFNPTSLNLKTATITIASNDPANPSTIINLRGLPTKGLGGANEPSLQQIFSLYNIPINVGDSDITTNTINIPNAMAGYNALLGDEIDLQKFEKADNGNVTLEPLACFGPTTTNPVLGLGWYKPGDINTLNEVFTISNTPAVNGQTVKATTSGNLSFDPGVATPFSFYTRWPFFNNRYVYGEDQFNTWDTNGVLHHVRVYALKDANGNVVPNAYIVAFEEHLAIPGGYDYQDVVFIVRNVKPYTPVVSVNLNFQPATKPILLAPNSFGIVKTNLVTSDSQDATVSLSVNYINGTNWLNPINKSWNTGFNYNFNLQELSFSVNTAGLAVGTYKAKVSANANGYVAGIFEVDVIVSNSPALPTLQVNFQNNATTTPAGWLKDFGEAYALRTGASQGTNQSYGWVKQADGTTPLDLTKNGRARNATDPLRSTLMHMQYNLIDANGTSVPGIWEVAVPNGYYDVTVTAGDTVNNINPINSRHILNVEGVRALAFDGPATPKIRTGKVSVLVKDGKLTIDAKGGDNTKIISAVIKPTTRNLAFAPTTLDISLDYNQAPTSQTINLSAIGGEIFDLTLTKSTGSSWLSIPLTVNAGNFDLGIDPKNLLPGTYYATLTANASGFTKAALPITLTIKAGSTSNINPAVLNFNIAQGGVTPAQNVDVMSGQPAAPINFSKPLNTDWLVLPTNAQTGNIAIGVNAGGLAPGNYSTDVTISSIYGVSLLKVNLVVNKIPIIIAPNAWDYKINFQRLANAIPTGYLQKDGGLAYQAQNGLTYGWIGAVTGKPQDNQAQMLLVSGTTYPTVPIELRSLGRMQQLGKEANWEIALPNGCYYVKVSVGDISTFNNNRHILRAEGKQIIAFQQDSLGRGGFKQDSAVVNVQDGKLTIDAYGGTNTKINYIWIEQLNPNLDNVPPLIDFAFDGVVLGPNTYRNPVVVNVDVTDQGCSGIANVEYSMNGGPYKPYLTPIVVNQAGQFTISARATDGQNNQSTTPYKSFKVSNVPISNAKLVLEDTTGFINGNSYVFSFIQYLSDGENPAFHDRNIVRIYNYGANPLIISQLLLSDSLNFRISRVNGQNIGNGNGQVKLASLLPLTINPGAFTDVTLLFTARRVKLPEDARVKIYHEKFTIVSNDDASPYKQVDLHATYQQQQCCGNEPDINEIFDGLGMTSRTGFVQYNQNHATPMGDEIFAPYLVVADARKPVIARQVTAYHNRSEETLKLRKKAGGTFNVMKHFIEDYQTHLPRLTNGKRAVISIPTGQTGAPFAFNIGGDDTDPFQNASYTKNQTCKALFTDPFGNPTRGIRFWRARDYYGRIIPNAYIFSNDYQKADAACTDVTANFDYNDNCYYVENVKPEIGTDFISELVGGTVDTPQSALNFNTAIETTQTITLNLRSLGETFANGPDDPNINISKIAIVGDNLEEFYYTKPLVSALKPGDATTMTVTFRPLSTGVKNATLLVYYDNTAPLRISLYGMATSSCFTYTPAIRIKGGATSNADVNIPNSGVWKSDGPFRVGSVKLDNYPGEVAGTDADALYTRYASSNADLQGIAYRIPLANAKYLVRLHFAEVFWTDFNKRSNNILIEGQPKLFAFDAFKEVGFSTATVRDFEITLTDGNLNIDFAPIVNRPSIAGIEIWRINQLSNMTLTSTQIVGAVCGSANGTITVQVGNVAQNTTVLYKLSKFGEYQTSPTFTNLAPGTHTIYVKEDKAGGCEASNTFTIPEVAKTITFDVAITPVVCGINNSGTATVSNIAGGVAPYAVKWSTNPVRNGSLATGLAAGNVLITITDAQGCSTSQTVNIPACNNAVNTAPTVSNAIPDVVVFKNSGQMSINIGGAFGDLENPNALTFNVLNNTNNALIKTQVVGKLLILTFTTDMIGTGDITIRAADPAGLSTTDIFNVKVLSYDIPVTQISRPILKGGKNRVILGIQLNNQGNSAATSFTFKTTGTTNIADITQAKLYKTNGVNFFNPVLVGNAINNPNGTFVFSGLNENLTFGINQYWLAYDISANATVGNAVDAELVSINIGGSEATPLTGNPIGNRTIVQVDLTPGRAIELDGIDDVISISDEANFDFSTGFTVEGWFKVNQFDKDSQTLISKGNSWGIARNAQTNFLKFYVAGIGNVVGLTNVADGEWHHIAGIFTGSKLQLYVDGNLDNELVAGGTITLNNFPVQIGANAEVAGRNFNGQIDEVRIWNVVRTEQQLRENIHLILTGTETGLAAYFQLNETSGVLAKDLINDITGTLGGGMTDANWIFSPVPIGSGTVFSANSIANGTVNFSSVGVSMTFGATHPNGQLVVTRINNVSPAGDDPAPGQIKSSYYWIVNNYGTVKTGLSPIHLQYQVPSGFLISSNPSNYKLFKRPSNGIKNWLLNFTATNLDLANNTIEFDGITSFSQTVIGGSGIGLPVSWVSFSGERLNANDVELTWKIALQKNNKGFEVLKSTDGNNYEQIGFVEGAGSIAELRTYKFTDHDAQKAAYYRLRQVDFDGQFDYSPQIIYVEGLIKDNLYVYPNPIVEGKELSITTSEEMLKLSNIRLEMINANGTTIVSSLGSISELKQVLNVELPKLKSGIYLLKFLSDKKQYIVKMIKH